MRPMMMLSSRAMRLSLTISFNKEIVFTKLSASYICQFLLECIGAVDMSCL
jgi:hypothetical protein